MLSIYVHIPFCKTKCSYCNFQVCPQDKMKDGMWDKMIEEYILDLEKEIESYSKSFPQKEIYTIYFGGGTPSIIGVENIIKIMDKLDSAFDLSSLAELSFELNPYPQEDIYNFVETISKKYKDYPRIRYSFGIQSFDNKVLQEHGRDSSFPGLVEFIRGLKKYKKDNMVYNFDFIAFGELNKTRKGDLQLWNPGVLGFFGEFVNSHLADSFSIYTLELFPGSWDYYKGTMNSEKGIVKDSKDDLIYEEFSILKDIVLDAGYQRYELSNFALPGKSSIHNRVYWEMGDYLGLGTSACGFLSGNNLLDADSFQSDLDLKGDVKGLRYENIVNLKKYSQGDFISETFPLTERDYLIEEFFIALRTDRGVEKLDRYKGILVDNYLDLISEFQKGEFVFFDDGILRLTDQGMDVYNSIITELLKEI